MADNHAKRNQARVFFSVILTAIAIGFFLYQFQSGIDSTSASSNETSQNPEYDADESDWRSQIVAAWNSISSDEVYSFECEYPSRKPETLSITCADLGIAVFNIKWKVWEATGAYGLGTYSENDCDPSCAEGTRHDQPVSIHLKDLIFDGRRYYLNTAVITPLNPNQDSIGTLEWNLGEFYRSMSSP